MPTIIPGIFQGDLVVRTAVIMALRELREHPELIDDALASLPQDDLTAGVYGEKTIAQCKDWFLATKVPVKLGISVNHLADSTAVIAIEMGTAPEGETTLGDVHYETSEDDPRTPGNRRNLESVVVNESYNLVVFAVAEPEYLLFLWSLVVFGLLRNKEQYLAQRGFDMTSFTVGVAGALGQSMDNIYMRSIQIQGKVRYAWPKASAPKIERVEFGTRKVSDVARLPTPNPFQPEDWESRDILTGIRST